MTEAQKEIAKERQRTIERVQSQSVEKELEIVELKKKIAELEVELEKKEILE